MVSEVACLQTDILLWGCQAFKSMSHLVGINCTGLALRITGTGTCIMRQFSAVQEVLLTSFIQLFICFVYLFVCCCCCFSLTVHSYTTGLVCPPASQMVSKAQHSSNVGFKIGIHTCSHTKVKRLANICMYYFANARNNQFAVNLFT